MTEVTISDRIQRRLAALKMTVVDAERLAGVRRTYIADIVSRRKKQVRQLAPIARALRTTEAWLLTGIGPEDAIYGDCEATCAPASVVGIDPPNFSVSAAFEDRIVITGLDVSTGTCSYKSTSKDGEFRKAKIIDPALTTVDSIYVQSLSRGRPIVALIKERLKDTDVVETFIVDAG